MPPQYIKKTLRLDHLRDFDGKLVLVRVDFNVPIEHGRVVENFRLKSALPTIKYIAEHHGRPILISHLGRPEGRYDKNYSLTPIYRELRKLLPEYKVRFWDKKISDITRKDLSAIEVGEIVLLENIRFYAGEDKNQFAFANALSRLGHYYVNEAFSFSHRRAASIDRVARLLPSYLGFKFFEEIDSLSKLIKPGRPAVAIIGGIKVETKLPLMAKLMSSYDNFLVGGVAANVFFAAQHYEIGQSVIDHGNIRNAAEMLDRFSKKIILPIDVLIWSKQENIIIRRKISEDKDIVYKADQMILDVGPATVKLFSKYVRRAKTIVWNGPMGKMEDSRFREGTTALAHAVAGRSAGPTFGAVGGGETIDALSRVGMLNDMDFVSTGGGAMLDFLIDPKKFPGLAAISSKK
ncbi:MAG: phosphoglycerate kinase [Patescibacteria group bacterium]